MLYTGSRSRGDLLQSVLGQVTFDQEQVNKKRTVACRQHKGGCSRKEMKLEKMTNNYRAALPLEVISPASLSRL